MAICYAGSKVIVPAQKCWLIILDDEKFNQSLERTLEPKSFTVINLENFNKLRLAWAGISGTFSAIQKTHPFLF